MRMTTIVNNYKSDVTTPTSYVSRWIAQSHQAYQKKSNEFYSPPSPSSSSTSSSCDFRTASNQTPPILAKTNNLLKPLTTTWQAQAKSRSNPLTTSANEQSPPANINNHELQEKLHRVR